METMHNVLKDIDGKEIKHGHILAVRYVWNSYAGIVTLKGLYVGGRYHPLENSAHYQVIGHQDESHKDYNEDVKKWIDTYLEGGEHGECPVKIRVYDNMK